MTDFARGGMQALIVGVQSCACAMPLMHVIEVMRPLPIGPISGAVSFVRGMSIVRGIPTPVVDLASLLGAPNGVNGRLVTLRLGNRQVALCVSAVLGVRELDSLTIQELPPLLYGAPSDVIDAIGTLDSQILFVLRSGWRLPDEVWQALAVRDREQ